MPADHFSDQRGNRRRFLGSSAGMAAGGVIGLGSAASSAGLRVGVIGVRARGRQLAQRFVGIPHTCVRAICDIDYAQASRAAGELQTTQNRLRVENDFQRILAADDIDAVVIATPDHWHARMCVLALAAGKHVFIETPLSHTITESADIRAAAAVSDRVVFCGLQQRSMPHVQSALAQLRSGTLGTVRLVKAWTSHRRRSIGQAADCAAPIGVDYEKWLGPAPSRPFNPNRFHYSWRWFWDYGGGELTNWGVHMIDIARQGLGVTHPTRVSATGGLYHFDDDQETPDTLTVNYDFGDRSLVWEHRQWSPRMIEGRSTGVAFYGEQGSLVLDRSGWKIYDSSATVAMTDQGRGDTVVEDFVNAIRIGDIRRDELESAAVSTDLCHLGNLAFRQQREWRADTAESNTTICPD